FGRHGSTRSRRSPPISSSASSPSGPSGCRNPMDRTGPMDPAESMGRLLDIASLDQKRLPERALRLAGLSLFDWVVGGQAGAGQPVSNLIRGFVEEEAGKAEASVIGSDMRLPARAAALANGTIFHALDYDDTHFAYIGHPSVAIFPAALAAAESIDA